MWVSPIVNHSRSTRIIYLQVSTPDTNITSCTMWHGANQQQHTEHVGVHHQGLFLFQSEVLFMTIFSACRIDILLLQFPSGVHGIVEPTVTLALLRGYWAPTRLAIALFPVMCTSPIRKETHRFWGIWPMRKADVTRDHYYKVCKILYLFVHVYF